MKRIKMIIIDDGDTFYGTPEQFGECFFSNVYPEVIEEWAEANDMKCEIEYHEMA